MPRFIPPSLLLVLAALAALPAQAAEAPAISSPPKDILSATLSTDRTSSASCLAGLRAAGGAVATRQVTLARAGYLYAGLRAARGDWDLAVYDAAGQRVSGGASPGGHEVASGYVDAGRYTLQACRRAGGASRAALVADFTPLPADIGTEKTQLVSVNTPSRAAKDRLLALGVDLTEHGYAGGLGVVLHGAADAEKLRRAGFTWEVKVPDLAARSLGERRADLRFAGTTTRSALPSGRDTYRKLEDYESEMKKLAQQNPGLVRLFELPHKTWEGRTVLGIEITTNVNMANGKPAFLNMGLHHAREWPSGEHAMEWAYELINGFKSGDARATSIVKSSRNIVVPVVNPDGFNASRTAGSLSGGDGGRDERAPDTALIVAGAANGGEYRRKNCRLPDDSERGNCATSAGLAEPGVDPNRNYGGLWGGPGADSTFATQTYRGPGPFSEPETRNIKELVGTNQVMTLITNHTTAGLVLRAPGIASLGDPVDEERGYKALGDELALHNGYFSQKSFELYDTTGTTEDWTYNTAGGFGFTFEIYCGRPNYKTGDCDDPAFHPLFETMVKEWTGDSDQANHVNDPGRSNENPFGNVAKFDGKGNREAYYVAAESTLNEARHSIIESAAPAGATLRIRKEFKTETSPQPQEDGTEKPILFDDSLESVYEVGSSGDVRWHINPSTRPLVAKDRGVVDPGEPAPPEEQAGSPSGSPSDPNPDGAVPGGDATTTDSTHYNLHPITVPATGDNGSANIRVVWETPTSDWDITLFEDADGNGDVNAGDKEVGSSAQGPTSEEEVGLTGKPRLAAGKKYVLRVTNFAATEPYKVMITWNGPEEFQAAQRENWTLTCEVGGKVLQTTEVYVDRGQVARPDLSGCRGAAAAQPGAAQPSSCKPGTGFRSTSVRGRGAGLAFSFQRRVTRPVGVDVFQVSSGRKVLREQLMARFRGRTKGFVWNGASNQAGRRVTDGYYFVRYRMQLGGKRADVRRKALRRSGGRFTVVKAPFYRRKTCRLLRWHKLTRPVFGGRNNRPLRASYRLNRPGRVTVTVTRDGKVVRRYAAVDRSAGKVYRVTLGAKKFGRGVYRVKLVVRDGAKTKRSTLTARRI